MSVVIIQPFRPFDFLKEKPVPGIFPHLVDEKRKTPEEGILLEKIIENSVDSNRSLDRNILLDRLQHNGFLVRPCEEMSVPDEELTPSSSSEFDKKDDRDKKKEESDDDDDDDDDDDNAVKEIKNKGKKVGRKNSDKIVLEDAIDKSMEEEKELVNDEKKEISLPKEHRFNIEMVNQELVIDDTTVFIVCNEKKDQKAPGKEPSETIPKERVDEFTALSRIPDWRQKLCNEYDVPFKLDEVIWKNVDHFILAAKYRKQAAASFADYDKALEIHKSKKINGMKILVDEDFKTRVRQEIYHALFAKFTQNPELARVLDATGDAKILFRVNKQVKEDFTEIMWLRQVLRGYVRSTLKPLGEEALPLKTRKKADKDDVLDMTNVSISKYAIQMPKYEPDILRVSSHYMNNRMEFIGKLNDMFTKLNKMKPLSSFDLMEHQRLVLNYIHNDRPYHGVLVFHNLGTGKSCTSIALAEGMKYEKQIVVMMPASLKTNYWSELQKCGDALYKQNQHWEFVSVDGKPELIPVLAKALSMKTDEIRKQKGAWMVNILKDPNFKNLSPPDQQTVQAQITHMIGQKYLNIHYNANNLGNKIAELGKGKKNPFDHTVVILDEAHNFVSRIVGNLRRKKKAAQSIYTKIYEQMLSAKDFRIVMLSGSPIINNPHEMGVMFNLLRGGISTWTLHVTGGQNTEQIKKVLEKGKCATFDFIDYKHGKLTITRNPYGFVNVNTKPASQNETRSANNNKNNNNNKTKRANQAGGYGEYGVTLDSRGNIDDDTFIKQVKHILKDNDMVVSKVLNKLEKCLPDDQDVFQKTFIRESTNFSDLKDTSTDLLKINTLRRRILGLTSYYSTSNEEVLPQIIKDGEHIFHEIRVPMSDYQFEAYAKVRKVELDKEKKQKTIRGLQKKVNNEELFSMNSSYRVFSRCCCNFAFPSPPGRPIPVGGKIKENEDIQEVDEASIEDRTPVDHAEFAEEQDEDDSYSKKISEALAFLRANKATVFSQKNLSQYSPKMLEILKRLKNPQNKGLHLVYSTFRTLEGIGIFQEVLQAHGYQEFKIAKKGDQWVLDFIPDGRPCYALYTGKEDAEMKEIVRNVFNGDWSPPNVPDSIGVKLREISSNNLYGEIVQVFMITASGAEGINLKNTRFVHIMEPYWHNVRLEQVMGRARRIRSHDALPQEHRTVQAFLYLSVMTEKQMKDDNFKEIQVNDLSKLRDNTPVTTDEFLYEISQMKQKINNQFLKIMKETAMDCHVHLHNHRKNEKLVCYAPVSGHRTFSDYPELEKVLQEEGGIPPTTPHNKR